MPLLLGNPQILSHQLEDGSNEQMYANCNEFGAQRIAPCGCYQPLNAEIPIAAGATFISPLLIVPDNSRWDIQLAMHVVSGNDITGWGMRYYPLSSDENIYDLKARFSDRIGAGETFIYYGLPAKFLDSMDNGSLFPFMHQALRLYITCDVGTPTVVKPVLTLTPRV